MQGENSLLLQILLFISSSICITNTSNIPLHLQAPVNDRRAPRNAVIKLFFDADESQQDTVIDLESDEQDVAILRSRIAQLESRCSTRDQAITTLRAEDGKKGLEISRANAELTLFRAALQERELRLQAALDNANKLAARYAQYDNEIKNNVRIFFFSPVCFLL